MANPLLGQSLSGGSLPRLEANATREETIAAINDIVDRLNYQLKTQTFADGNSKRWLMGFVQDGWGPGKNFGIKVSIPGVDVTIATDAQLMFSMDLQSWYWYTNGIPQTLVGAAPDDGRSGTWTTKPGISVKTSLGG